LKQQPRKPTTPRTYVSFQTLKVFEGFRQSARAVYIS
jgi:hypothetical protein